MKKAGLTWTGTAFFMCFPPPLDGTSWDFILYTVNGKKYIGRVSTALSTWGAIGTTDPVELGDSHQALTDAAELLSQLQRDIVLLRDAMLVQDNV